MANPVSNPSFEIPGLSWGQAADWTESYSSGAEDIGLFYNGMRSIPWENFEDAWLNSDAQAGFGSGDLVAALFETWAPHEDFETTWSMPSPIPTNGVWNHHSQSIFTSTMLAYGYFDSVVETFEDFEEEWTSNEDALTGYSPLVSGGASRTVGTFTDAVPENIEDFEEDWYSNDDAKAGFAPVVVGGGAATAAQFDGATLAYEGFEGTWTMTFP